MRPQRKAEEPQRGEGASPRSKGYRKVLVALTPEQATALKREAFRRSLEAGGARPDAGQIVREALDAWLAKNAKR